MDIAEAKRLFDLNESNKALEILNDLISSDNKDLNLFLLRGRIYYKMQRWGDAMNDFSTVLELDADNQEAKSGIGMAKSILGYFTPDMFNP
jgi:tetratricopeptide (TPR) repeat protein